MEKKTWIIIGVVAFVLIVIGSFMPDAERLIYTNDVLYDCKEGTYYFPASEQIFEKVSEVGFIDYQSNSKDNVCIFSLNYKVKVAPTDNPSYEISFDTCKITVSQLAYFKEKKADLMTMLKDASCVENTIPFLEKAIKPLDFQGQVKELLSDLGTSNTQFLASFDEWVNGIISYEDFQEALKNEKRTASKTFKGLQDLQPKPEDKELQAKAVHAVELYLDSLNSFEEALSKQSSSDFESSMDKSTAQMDEATMEVLEVITLLENE